MPNWSEIRKDFPVLQRVRYFYTASGGPIPKPVQERAAAYYREASEWGDIHWERQLEERERIRECVADFINASPQEVEFVPSTAQGMNIVAWLLSNEGRVVAPTLEFPDTTLPWLHLEPDCIDWVQPDEDGAVPASKLLARRSAVGGVIATSHVQFSNGFRQDLQELGAGKGKHRLVVNATQSLGAFKVDVREIQADALCCNSYKWMLAGYGCGILYVNKDILKRRESPGVGWFGVEDRDSLRNDRYRLLGSAARFNWGSPSFPPLLAFGAAVDYINQIGIENIEKRVLSLNRYLTQQLSRAGFTLLSPLAPDRYRSGEVLVELAEPENTVRALAERNVICTLKPEGMRVATHFFVNEEDIDVLIRELQEVTRS